MAAWDADKTTFFLTYISQIESHNSVSTVDLAIEMMIRKNGVNTVTSTMYLQSSVASTANTGVRNFQSELRIDDRFQDVDDRWKINQISKYTLQH